MDPSAARTARSKGKTRWRWCAWRASIWCWLIQSTPLLLQDLCNLIHMQNSSAQSCRARKHTRNLQNHVLLMPQVLAIRKPLPNIFFLNLVFLYTKLLVFFFFFQTKQNKTFHFTQWNRIFHVGFVFPMLFQNLYIIFFLSWQVFHNSILTFSVTILLFYLKYLKIKSSLWIIRLIWNQLFQNSGIQPGGHWLQSTEHCIFQKPVVSSLQFYQQQISFFKKLPTRNAIRRTSLYFFTLISLLINSSLGLRYDMLCL